MKKLLSILCCLTLVQWAMAQMPETEKKIPLPDSLRSVAILVQLQVQQPTHKREVSADVSTGPVTLKLETEKGKRKVEFEFPEGSQVVSKNLKADVEEEDISLEDAWAYNEVTLLMIATAADSAAGFTLYSAYVQRSGLPWQLIGTCRVPIWNKHLQEVTLATDASKRRHLAVQWQQLWSQRSNGSWQSLLQAEAKPPTINWTAHADSTAQAVHDDTLIRQAMQTATYTNLQPSQGIYYQIMEAGKGRSLAVSDTISVFYKGYLFSNNEVFDETKGKPATFPLNRLIKGWQIALPLIKTGGKIKVVIPSGQAYSIRTRAAKIPPNSILVFEIEVTDSQPSR